MKTLDALYPLVWSITALATLYLVLHRPARVMTDEGSGSRTGCELTLLLPRPAPGVVMRGVIDRQTQCGFPIGTVLTLQLSEPGR